MNSRIYESDSALAETIEKNLLDALRNSSQQARNEQIVLGAESDEGLLIGGLTCSTSYGWLLIKTLWVEESQRRKNIGSSLMREAESRGRAVGCHSSWLDTSSPAAAEFYKKLGYSNFAELKNSSNQIPVSHHRWFMSKTL